MTSKFLHTPRPNCQLKVGYAPGFYVSFDFLFFALWGAEMYFFQIATIPPRSMY